MLSKFKGFIDRIARDEMNALSVEVLGTKIFKLDTNMPYSDFVNKYGSAEGFLQQLNDSGYTSVVLHLRRRSGSVRGIPKFTTLDTISFQLRTQDQQTDQNAYNNNQMQVTPQIPQPIATAAQQFQQHIPALNGTHGIGLTGMDAFKVFDHERLKTENTELRAKVKELETELYSKKEEILKNQYSTEKQSNTTNMISAFAPLLAPVLEKMAIGSAVPAVPLAGEYQLSPIKEQFIEQIKNSTDEAVQYFQTLSAMMQNESFNAELEKLFDAYGN